MKKILFVVDEKKLGGVSILLEDMFNIIDMSKYKIDLLVLHNNGECFQKVNKNVKIIYGTRFFDVVDLSFNKLVETREYLKAIKKLYLSFLMKTGIIKMKIISERKKILSEQYDIEIAFKDGFTAVFTAFGNSKRKIHWLHYEYEKINPNGKYAKLFNEILPTFDKIVAVSDNVMKKFNKIYNLKDKTFVINNLVNTDRILSKSKEKCEIKLIKNKLNFVSVGRLHQQKGYDRLLEAIKSMNIKYKDKFVIDIYGGGPEEQKYINRIKEYNIDEIVNFRGQVMNPYKYLKKYDAFILPSFYEPFGLVIVESMTLGVPVIACENDATALLISNNSNGHIVENTIEGIKNGLEYIINNPDELKKYKEKLKDYRYDNDKIIKQINNLLK